MNKRNFTTILLAFLFAVFCVFDVVAQQKTGNDFVPAENDQAVRQNLLRELGLTREQIQQIRQLNVKRQPLMQEAQTRVREANRELDQAIYVENLDETLFELRLKAVQNAQAEVLKLRATNELEVRKILSTDQLMKFRQLRERFNNAKEALNERRRLNQQENKNRQMNKNNSDQKRLPLNDQQKP